MKRARLNHMMAFPGIALALVLVGCGGGGGDEVADMTPIMTPMPPAPPRSRSRSRGPFAVGRRRPGCTSCTSGVAAARTATWPRSRLRC